MDESLVVFTRSRVADLAGMSERRIDYWARTGLIEPSIDKRLTPKRPVRLYGYNDLMSLLIIAELRKRSVSLQHIRQIVDHIRTREYDLPEVVFAIVGSRVHFQTPDGEWEDAVGGQLVMHQVLHLEPLRARIRAAGARDPKTIGRIESRRGVLGSKPVIAGTRVPVDAVRRFLAAGASDDDVIDAYPLLLPADIDAARREVSA